MDIEHHKTIGQILCCECGTQIEPNPSNMCVACIRTHVDITEGIPKQTTIYFCRNCERYLQPPSNWIQAALESRELLAVCLKKLKGLNKVRLVDAGFIWTEPHSKRLKVKVTIQKEVLNGAVLEQVFVVEFTVNNQMCDDCHRVEAKDYWKAVVQIRQKASHKKTLYYLEQLMLKYRTHVNTVSIKPVPGGIDFFYSLKQHAKKLIDWLPAVVPCRYQTSQHLISHDIHNNTYNYKFTFSVELVPVCKDNVVCLSKKLAAQLGGIGQICVCIRVTQAVHLIDPNTLRVAEVSGTTFWRDPFESLCSPRQLTEYIVMDIEVIQVRKPGTFQHLESTKHVLAEVYVSKSNDIGSGQQYFCRTHLGHILNVGDSVFGFDMTSSNVNNKHLESVPVDQQPDVVLVKKVYDRSRRNQKRKWHLKHLDNLNHAETQSNERDYTDFMEDLEEDAAFRQGVNIYKDHTKIAVDQDEMSSLGGDLPQISLQEMLDDLHIGQDATEEEAMEGGAMIQ